MTIAAPHRNISRPLVLGINAAYHQTSAAILDRNGIIAAVEEERFNRVKHGKPTTVETTAHLPFSSIEYCLEAAGCALSEVDFIAYSFDPDARERHSQEISEAGPILGGGYETERGDRQFLALMRQSPALVAARFNTPEELVCKRWVWVDHHLAHLASAYLASPFDEAVGLVVDGIGEAATTTVALCRGVDMRILQVVDFPHSIGFVWELMTNFLGFEGNYDECKVMGLAAWGDPDRYLANLRRLISPMGDGTFRVDFADHGALLGGDYGHIERLLAGVEHRVPHEPIRYEGSRADHADVAAALQAITNELLLNLTRGARQRTGAQNLVMAGGVALNAVANGVIAREAGFADLWIQPAASDSGTALGAALYTLHASEHGGVCRRVRMTTPYLGPQFTDDEIVEVLDRHRLQYRRISDPPSRAAYELEKGRTVGWFQGRMEFGPRALGNRSLLADPRQRWMKDRINRDVKHRQDFRPFAPSVLSEHIHEWFEGIDMPTATRYMLATWPVKARMHEDASSVVHIDGSSRLQVVEETDNPQYHRLIRIFHERTGVPMVLNTSLNDREPIVCTPDDAARCFLKTNIDVMILGNYLVEGPKPWDRSDHPHTVADDLLAFGEFLREGR